MKSAASGPVVEIRVERVFRDAAGKALWAGFTVRNHTNGGIQIRIWRSFDGEVVAADARLEILNDGKWSEVRKLHDYAHEVLTIAPGEEVLLITELILPQGRALPLAARLVVAGSNSGRFNINEE